MENIHRVVIVGGGAGGLELATKLGNTLGKKKLAEIILIDAKKTHVWKPLLHEIAAGSLNPDKDELEYLAQAHWHHFKFRYGRVNQVNSKNKTVSIEPTYDIDGTEIIPLRKIKYDTLVLSVGSTVNDFNIPGAKEFAVALDTQDQAERFHQKLHNSILRAQTQKGSVRPGQLEVVIVGGGATGVELAAELHKATREMTAYGLDRVNPDRDISIYLVEASNRLLPALPPKISVSVESELRKLNVKLFLGERVTKVTKEGIETQSGKKILSTLVVWAAGIKAPEFLSQIKGIEANSIHQIMVESTLQSTSDADIFAFGDCAACPVKPGSDLFVPPRAQAAHQQASMLYKSIKSRILKPNRALPKYVYKDYGSLVNLGRYSTVGNLMGSLLGGSMFIEGLIARLMYLMLYQMHLSALHGVVSVVFRLLGKIISRRTEARVKLH
ncbi:pyridine nucleotide-disulfide oxidoreductase [Methylophilales bacterium MBRSG12]|uniref:Pyridine nucleotide-disulfide oxidoreductase n=1 Tax=Methylophilales bacterium MBRS-H7 TaxID=1623450 RepID=A0A0H4J2M6_9PROT|nr:pyridine nucleotide-disulfide oxidoreductase [Methylophilales bacterium MBRSF5]AKO65998.1 pyridine nucleotide-disulfide oxidoreductase [Methylophilales bacterium MBRS-H7]AKO67317.1 pyridine nucleotide-disulfide oxidoreductase [Methylophilales bacterium MBRSG12]